MAKTVYSVLHPSQATFVLSTPANVFAIMTVHAGVTVLTLVLAKLGPAMHDSKIVLPHDTPLPLKWKFSKRKEAPTSSSVPQHAWRTFTFRGSLTKDVVALPASFSPK